MGLPLATNLTQPKAWGYQARINDLYVRLADIADGSYLLQTEDADERSLRVIENPEDVSQSTGLLFSRSDFSGGEGLGFAHRRDNDERSPSRFWASSGVDVELSDAGELSAVTLLPSVGTALDLEDLSSTATGVAVNGAGDRAFIAEGHSVRHSTNLSTWTAQNPLGSGTTAVQAIAALGPEVYAGYADDGIRKRDAGGTWAAWSDLDADGLWAAKDRIIAASGTGLYQAGATNTSTLLHTLPAGFVWNDVAEAGRDIVAVASNGRMYFFTVGADLTISLSAQVTTPDEVPTCVTAVHDTLFWGTKQQVGDGLVGRWWRATLAPTTSTFTAASVIREWSDSELSPTGTDLAPRSIFATRDAVFIGVGEGQLWRYDLRNGARQSHLYMADAGVPEYIAQFQGRLVFTASRTTPTETAGLYAESTSEYVSSGWLVGPMGDLFTAENKAWAEAKLEVSDFGSGSVTLAYSTNPETLRTVTTQAAANPTEWTQALTRIGPSSPETAALSNVSERFIAGRIQLNRATDATKTPRVDSFSFRAYPDAPNFVVQLPVLVSDMVQLAGKRKVRARGLGREIYDRLNASESGSVEMELLDTDEIFDGRIRQISHMKEVTDRRGHRQLMAMVTFSGRRRGSSEAISGGTMADVDGYRYHTFTEDGVFSLPAGANDLDVLVVAGGGGGGTGDDGLSSSGPGGGGGGGGVLLSTAVELAAANYSVTVGQRGLANVSGGNSVFADFTAIGGGRGARDGAASAGDGGSGGGANGESSVMVGGAGTTGQGFKGGDAVAGNYSGGGGGATEAGADGGGMSIGKGGEGLLVAWEGAAGVYGSGGGGVGTGEVVSGGDLKGQGGTNAGGGSSINAVDGFGGGGGGGGQYETGGRGGHGRVVIRYPIPT